MEKNNMNFSQLNNLELEEKIVEANFDNDLTVLRDIFLEKKLADIRKITDLEKWNYLHRILCYSKPKKELVQFYIDNGVDVKAQDMYGMTPLHYAMRDKNVDAAIVLLNAGADPNIPDRDHATALAYINGMPEEIELLKLMLEKGGDVHFNNGQHEILEGIKKYRSEDPKFKPVIELMEKYA